MATLKTLALTLGGTPVTVTHDVVPLTKVRLNPQNPRIRFQLQQRKLPSPSENDLMALIRDQPGYDALHKAIRKANGLYEPIIVRHDGLIIEGNTRGAVFKSLHKGSPTDVRWRRIPVARLPRQVPDHALAMLMASYHVAGKTVWRPYAQADHIHQLRHIYGRTAEQIADETRMTPKEVQQYIDAYKYLIDEVLPHVPNGGGMDVLESKFSHALEFVKRKNLTGLRESPKKRQHVAKLIAQNKIKGIEVRQLDKVLKNPKASTALKKNGFKAAKEVLTETDPAGTSKILKDMTNLTHKLSKMGGADISLLKTSTKAQKVLVGLHKAVQDVAAIAAVKLGGRGG